jgi:hypothetical protein
MRLEDVGRLSTLPPDMSWLDKLEKRIGFIAIPGLIRILVGFSALVFLLVWRDPAYISVLDLDPARIRHGEVWRLFTYVFIPQTLSPLWILLVLWFLWWIGEGLERAFGPFRLTLYFLIGMIGNTAVAFFFGSGFANSMLVSSLFYAFARFYPDEVIYIMFILPMKIKWVAWAYALILFIGFFAKGNDYRLAVIISLSNYLIFFGADIIQDARQRRDVKGRRERYETSSRDVSEPLHKCATCGATEVTDPNLDFRVARDGEEYCVPHLPR